LRTGPRGFPPTIHDRDGALLRRGMARREAHAVNANGVPSSSPGLFRSHETTLGPFHPTKPPTLKGLHQREPDGGGGIFVRRVMQPFQGWGVFVGGVPRVARSGQPWAGSFNPVGIVPWLCCGMAQREAHAVNANGVPSSSPGLFRSNETTLGPSHPTKPPTLKGFHQDRSTSARFNRLIALFQS